MATNNAARPNYLMNLVETTEVRIEAKKVLLPVKLLGMESDNLRALTFYSTAGKLAAHTKDNTALGRINALADNVNLSHLAEISTGALFTEYVGRCWDPANWKILSFHDSTGQALTNSSTAADAQILKPAGDANTNLAAGSRREEDIKFVLVEATIDLSMVTQTAASSTYTLTTFVQLPLSRKTVKNSAGNDVTAHTFHGNDDIRTYSPSEFKAEVLDITRQKAPASGVPTGLPS